MYKTCSLVKHQRTAGASFLLLAASEVGKLKWFSFDLASKLAKITKKRHNMVYQ